MCKFCENMKPLIHKTFHDGTYFDAVICPVSFKDKGPYIYILHNIPKRYGIESYADAIFIKYCPMCGAKLVKE